MVAVLLLIAVSTLFVLHIPKILKLSICGVLIRYRFVELYYHRTEYKNMENDAPPRVETVVIYLPDVHSCMPTLTEYETLSGLYRSTAENIIARRTAAFNKNAIAAANTDDNNESNANAETENGEGNNTSAEQNDDEGDGDADGTNVAADENDDNNEAVGEADDEDNENGDEEETEEQMDMDNSGDAANEEADDNDMGQNADHAPDAADENVTYPKMVMILITKKSQTMKLA